MALQFYKLVVETTLTDTQYFTELTADITLATTATPFPATDFLDGAGSGISTFTPATSNGYYTLFIGGAMQQTGIYTVDANDLTITLATGTQVLTTGTPISLTVTESTVTS